MTYEYTLNDLYVMFRQAEKSERLKLLIEWEAMNLPYLINWEKIIQLNS